MRLFIIALFVAISYAQTVAKIGELTVTYLGRGYCGTGKGNGWPAYYRSQGATNNAMTQEKCQDACVRLGKDCRGFRWYKGPTGKCMVYTETAKSMQGDWFWSKPRTDSNGPITWARDGHRHGKCFNNDVQRIETVDVDLKITFISNGYCG